VKLGEYSGKYSCEQDTAMAFHPHVLNSPDRAAVVEENLHFISNRTMVTSAHMQATDKMGSTPQNSVVAQDFHVWGTRRLYFVDGSIFPTSVGANPMQSIYMIAKIFTNHWNDDSEMTTSAAR
jgi:choline dehydrogenase-like flavoprotein